MDPTSDERWWGLENCGRQPILAYVYPPPFSEDYVFETIDRCLIDSFGW